MVRVGNNISTPLILNTGAPQGCVLSPLLYSLFTHDCVATHASNSIKFADDTTVVGLITNNDETAYREEVRALGVWCSFTSTKQRRRRDQYRCIKAGTERLKNSFYLKTIRLLNSHH